MKKTAVLLLLAFSLLQVSPVISSFFSDIPSLVMIDEEKSSDKGESDNKSKKAKDMAGYMVQEALFTRQLESAFHLTEKISPFPCLERPTPPPNYC